MLDAIRFVRGAISDKANIVPVLSHFYIKGKHIQGSDGRMWIDAPCPELICEAVVPAERFLRAVDTCGGEPVIRFTDSGRMVVERKPFRSILPVLPVDSFPFATETKGTRHKILPGFLGALRILRDFLSTDAERMWATAVLFNDGVAYATNSATIGMVRVKSLPLNMMLPLYIIEELLRINQPPDSIAADDKSFTFFWGKDIGWLRALPITDEWPIETAKKWLATKMSGLVDIPKTLAPAIEKLLPFCNDPKFPIIYFSDKGISTAPGEVQAEISGFKGLGTGAFRADNLAPMLRQADKMIITERAALFTGPDSFRGVMAPLRTGGGA